MEVLVPPIVAGRFGLEQRCAYRHHDLYDEEVPEVDLETAVSRPDLGSGCAVRSFLLLGDQNAGKSTMLHSFCREGDPSFMQLSSLLPVLSSSFINTRLVPHSALGLGADLNQDLSVVRDELPFMDTDIARGVVMLTLENFAFFCNEFGIAGYGAEPGQEKEGQREGGFHPDVRFVALQFVELGGDHLDRLLRFTSAGGDLAAVRAAEKAANASLPGDFGTAVNEREDDAFWADIHEVLLGSLRLLKDTARTVYFINCAVLLPAGTLNPAALRSMLRKLRFLDGALGAGQHGVAGLGCEVLFYCSRAPAVDTTSFDVAAAWAAARRECITFAREELGSSSAASAQKLLPAAPPGGSSMAWEVGDEGLDLSALEEVAGSEAHAWRKAEERAGPLLAFIREMLSGLVLPALRTRLRLVGVHAVRNLADVEGAIVEDKVGNLCVSSIVRNVARLLQCRVCKASQPGAEGGADNSLVPHVAELILRCAASLRHVEEPALGEKAATVLGRWVTLSDLADHLEEREAQHAAVPIPEVATLQCWASSAAALVSAGICSELAPGEAALPSVALELIADGSGASASGGVPTICIQAAGEGGTTSESKADDDIVFVTSLTRTGVREKASGPEAVGLPLDPELFALLSSESALHGATTHLTQARAAGDRFHFSAPEAILQLRRIHSRLRLELDELISQVVAWASPAFAATSGALPPGTFSRVLHLASDAWQAEALLGSAAGDGAWASEAEPAAKRVRSVAVGHVEIERLVGQLAAAAAAEPGINVALSEPRGCSEGGASHAGLVGTSGVPLLRARLPL